jgi:transcription elongation factor Elf1
MEKQRWDACVDCGVEKTTRKQRGTARCRPCGIRFAYQDPELRARVAEHTRKTWEDPAHRERVSISMKERLEDPEMRERWRWIQNLAWNDSELRIKQSLRLGGNGDLKRIERARRGLEEYRRSVEGQWSMAVRERDGHRCQHCGSNGKLHAHHIKPRAMFPELALELDNGLTLCEECHVEEHRRLRASTEPQPPMVQTRPKR